MDPFEDNMNKGLRQLAEDIIPSDQELEKANDIANKVSGIIFALVSP